MKAEKLADTFISIIQEWLTEDEIAELREKNRSLKESNICASHDYCDANQAMIDALEQHNISLDIQSDEQVAMINKAWDIAKENDFATRLELLDDLGFPMLSEWIADNEITYKESLDHLEENKYMMDDEEDKKAFLKAEQLVRSLFSSNEITFNN